MCCCAVLVVRPSALHTTLLVVRCRYGHTLVRCCTLLLVRCCAPLGVRPGAIVRPGAMHTNLLVVRAVQYWQCRQYSTAYGTACTLCFVA